MRGKQPLQRCASIKDPDGAERGAIPMDTPDPQSLGGQREPLRTPDCMDPVCDRASPRMTYIYIALIVFRPTGNPSPGVFSADVVWC